MAESKTAASKTATCGFFQLRALCASETQHAVLGVDVDHARSEALELGLFFNVASERFAASASRPSLASLELAGSADALGEIAGEGPTR